ncbi:hypothetical protein C1646_798359 [Rhizophagus diaphanus]|nr:hypothetical protein C1646_798359 [Rhizophagus diaphanus] [Rhizophagus sp. MUCL 43196]
MEFKMSHILGKVCIIANLVIPYVSSMLAESLGDLSPLLLIAGEGDKFRDEAIYFAHRASEPTNTKFIEHACATKSYERMAFVNRYLTTTTTSRLITMQGGCYSSWY